MWAFTIKNKLTAAALLFTVLALVMLTNLQEQRLVTQINKAVTSLYEDRIVVGNYILTLSNHMEDILTLLNSENHAISQKTIDLKLNEIDSINNLYDQTVLTEVEQNNFTTFKAFCDEIKRDNNPADIYKVRDITKKAIHILETLSSIQVEEGRSKLDEVLKITNTSNILSYIEIVVLIIISILIQMLVFSSKSLLHKNKTTSNHHLN